MMNWRSRSSSAPTPRSSTGLPRQSNGCCRRCHGSRLAQRLQQEQIQKLVIDLRAKAKIQ